MTESLTRSTIRATLMTYLCRSRDVLVQLLVARSSLAPQNAVALTPELSRVTSGFLEAGPGSCHGLHFASLAQA